MTNESLLAIVTIYRYTMPCPSGCEPEVHEKVMLPCWSADPRTRPGFAELMDTLVDLGAVPPQAISRTRTERNMSSVVVAKKTTRGDDMRELMGPSVHHIMTDLTPKVIVAFASTPPNDQL